WDSDSPISTAAQEGIKPAIGPAIPISNNAVRVGIGPLIRMKAPNVPIKLGVEVMPHLMREQYEHQRERKVQAMHQFCRSLPQPLQRKHGNVVIAERESWLLQREVGIDACPYHHRAQEGRGQKQDMQPPARARRWYDPDPGLRSLVPFKGALDGGCGFGHTVSGLI